MASIASSTNIGSSGASSIRGYGGLASGLDRDSLIESMTAATRAKIAKQQQKKQTYQWTQEAYRSISDKLVQFSRKYTSYTSSSNLSSSSFWARSSITALGSNSKYVSVSGSSSLADSVSIAGVKQLAKEASKTSSGSVSDRILSTGNLDITNADGTLKTEAVSNLEGQSLYFKYGNKTIGLSLPSGTTSDGFTYDYSTAEKAQESINKAMKNVSVGNGKTLADVLEVQTGGTGADNTLSSVQFKSKDTAGNTIMFAGGSQTALEALGIVGKGQSIDDLSNADKTISKDSWTDFDHAQTFFTDKTFIERTADKSISFTYNGVTKSIKMSQKELEDAILGKNNSDAVENVAKLMEEKLGKQFGEGRISVDGSNGKLEFKTTIAGSGPDAGQDDETSILAISSAETGVIGKTGAFKVEYGESNRVNTSASLKESGLSLGSGITWPSETDTTYFAGSIKVQELVEKLGNKVSDTTTVEELKTLISNNFSGLSDKVMSSVNEALDHFSSEGASTVGDLMDETNGKLTQYVEDRELDLTINGVKIKGLTANSTVNELISAVNSSDAQVTLSYMKNADKFTLVSTAGGASGKVELDSNAKELLFGAGFTEIKGQDAIIGVKYAGSNDVVELRRGNNAFNLDGLNITVNGTFGYDEDGNRIADTEGITFDSKVDSDKIVEAVKTMIDDLNEVIELVNKEVSTKPNRNYSPLTDEQKEELSEEQIEKWEAKAKEGILFGDADLRSLSDSLRFIFNTGSEENSMLESFGISKSTSYGDNGKLVFDEAKFRAALDSNPEDLKELFTKTADNTTGDKGGFMARLTTITEKYASTSGATKGILIERAGSTYAPTSILSNYLQKSIDSVDDNIDRLKDKLKIEQDRYISQFTSLETLISQMNSQSSWLSSSFG